MITGNDVTVTMKVTETKRVTVQILSDDAVAFLNGGHRNSDEDCANFGAAIARVLYNGAGYRTMDGFFAEYKRLYPGRF